MHELSPTQLAFRDAMAGVCTPVSVVTTVEHGRPHGTTVSAFASLSMDPPMVLVSLDAGSELLAMVRRTGTIGLNVLAADQSTLALRFARKGADKFDAVPWHPVAGAARLDGVAAWVGGTVDSVVAAGDHQLVLAHVRDADAAPGEPLTYHDRTFGTHLRHEGAA
ncbi:hypothetical protein GCM10009613_05200 [Pseudonocardia kongjuensis]|uniref:Flavin reductase like domain-containing protein n=1 Tax=Pseudonocardia kongjuensis TaxID=102227 RepID=A0ABN1XH64_9PSEU